MTSTALDIETLFTPFARARRILLAISGGPDSMALLHLARVWRDTQGAPPIEAATVDHGLRPDSAIEAERVAGWAGAMDIPHQTLVWAGEKPRTRLQERARNARYELLLGKARSIGADVLLTAHHADDQAETVLFRLLRGSGPAGLAGMSAMVRRGDVTLGRPLLTVSKEKLIGFCHSVGQAFIEDPSNLDPKFARVRMRRILAVLQEEGLRRDDLLRLSARAARAEVALSEACGQALARVDAQRGDRFFSCDLNLLEGNSDEFLVRLLVQEISRVSERAVRLERAETLSQRLAKALAAGREMKASLGGAILHLKGDGRLTLAPEPARRRPSRRLSAGDGVISIHAER